MAVSLQIGVKQTQRLAMTQSLKQAIELLQLSTVELSERISQELIENPVIEESDHAMPSTDGDDDTIHLNISKNLSGDNSLFSRGEDRRINFGNTSDSGYTRSGEDDRNRDYLESVVAHQESLIEHMLWQARLSAEDEKTLMVYQSVITSLDDRGFLTCGIEEFITPDGPGPEEVGKIIRSIQLFDPVGCAVPGARESLLIQARHFHADDRVLQRILEEHFEDLEKLEYRAISRALNIPVSTVIEKNRLIQGLDPFPGRIYAARDIRYIIPDIEVRYIDGELIISMNDDWVPTIRINSYYIDLLHKKNIEKNIRVYIQDKLQSARYLIKNISSRRNTITRVVRSIMEHQKDFLLRGPGHLNSLTHVDIAQELGIHESTVSRVTSNKFVQTSWGVFELKYFFVSRLKSAENGDGSSDRVLAHIRDIIGHENGSRPFSDEEIVKILAGKGVSIARRTVAKYRGILNIPSSSKRKKLYMIKSEESL